MLGLGLVLAGRVAEADSLTISPSHVVLPLGGAQRLEVRDSSGAPVSGVEWSLSASDVVSLSTSPIVTVAAVGAGEVTITATIGAESAEATVTVVPASEVPADVPMWKLPRTVPDDGTPSVLVQAQNDDGAGADYFLVEGSGSTPIIRGVRLDGTEAWRRTFGAGLYVGPIVADSNGGVILSTFDLYTSQSTLLRLEGHSGIQTWQLPRNGRLGKAALPASGTLVMPFNRADGLLSVLGVNASTGAVQFDQPVANSDYGWGLIVPDWLSDFTVGHDGQVYVLRQHAEITEGSQIGYDDWLDLTMVQTNGDLAVVATLAESHHTDVGNTWYDFTLPGQVFPGAEGGLTLTWYRQHVVNGARTFVTTINGGRSDVELPALIDAVGSNGAAYGHRWSDGVIAAYDSVSGAPEWVSTETGELTAVLADESVVARNSMGESVRIDNVGQAAPLAPVPSASDAVVDQADQRLMFANGELVAAPGAGVELDGLFPLQDGNASRQRRRPDPGLTVSRATVTRGEIARFRLSGVLPSEVTAWRFIPDDESQPVLVRNSTSTHSLTWIGKVVVPGHAQVVFQRGGTTRTLERSVHVAPRPGRSLKFEAPAPIQKPAGFDPGSGPMTFVDPPQPHDRVGVSKLKVAQYELFMDSLIDDSGPNDGYRTLDSVRFLEAPSSQPYFYWALSPAIEPGSTFYQAVRYL